jgi:hypothetical protein
MIVAGRVGTAVATAAAMAFVAIGLFAIATLGLTEIYADQWRHYVASLQHPFPDSLFIADNGHRTVVTSLIRWIEMRTLSGNQWLQLIAGALFAMTALLVFSRAALSDRNQSTGTRFLTIALFAFTLFWLGNARVLLHSNESSNVFVIILLSVVGLALVSGARGGWGRTTAAAFLGVVATFSFGSGVAAFAGFAVVLVVQRRYRDLVVMSAIVLVALALYVLLPDDRGVRVSLPANPLANLHAAATWLSSMWVQLLAPFTQLDAGNTLPAGLRAAAGASARLYHGSLGVPYVNTLPFAVIGWSGLAVLIFVTVRGWRDPASNSRLRLVGLGLSWFAFAVAGIVSLGRLDYFDEFPGQIFANRYTIWSCVFWCGLLVAVMARTNDRSTHSPRFLAHSFALGVLLLGLLTTRGHWIWAEIVQQGVRLDSAGFAVDVVDPDRDLGETIFDDVRSGIGPLRAAGISAFDWPEARIFRAAIDSSRIESGVRTIELKATRIGNRLGGEAMRVELEVDRIAAIDMPPRLLVAADGHAVGILIKQPEGSGWRYAGFANATVDEEELSIGPLMADGTIICWTDCDDSVDP